MRQNEIKLTNFQIITSILFIISVLISIVLTIDEKLVLEKKKPLFSKKTDQYINLFNRIFTLIIICFILYINYEGYKIDKIKGSNIDASRHQIYASILSVISAIIVLYVVFENWDENINITSIENPTI